MPYVTIEEEVWVDLDDFDTDDLIEEVNSRKASTTAGINGGPSAAEIVNAIYLVKHVRNQDYSQLVDDLIYSVLGKVV